MGRTFIDAGAQSTVSAAINNSQTTLVLASSANFGAPTVPRPTSVIILDSGNPAYVAANPLATPYEYQLITNNNTGTNTLTINNGTRAAYAGTTPHSFFAGATVAAATLAEDYAASFPDVINGAGNLPSQSAIKMQSGRVTFSLAGTFAQSGTVTFPTAFTASTNPIVLLQIEIGANFDFNINLTGQPGNTSFGWRAFQNTATNGTYNGAFHWLAIGQ